MIGSRRKRCRALRIELEPLAALIACCVVTLISPNAADLDELAFLGRIAVLASIS